MSESTQLQTESDYRREATRQNSVGGGRYVPSLETVTAFCEHVTKGATSLVPALGLLSLKGKPYTLNDHFPMEPLFKIKMPRKIIVKCGRQISKSMSLSSSGILRCASFPYLQMLYVTPRYEQVRRLSTNYVRPLINQSCIKEALVDETCVQAVLQRSFSNDAAMYFSFAFLDVDRIRGLSVDWVNLDEVQDLDYDFVPIIHECMSASQIGMAFYSGTPKTLDNGIEALWSESSKAEWVTKCEACNHWNMACIQQDLLKMIGQETVVCARCSRPINPRVGHWHHTAGRDHPQFHGYHIPQIIMPMHYANPMKWRELLSKRDGKGGYSNQKFLNEVLGESADVGVKLITITDIKNASVLGPNDYAQAVNRLLACKVRVLGVDWGGGGIDETSFTTAALVGLNAQTGKVECHYCIRFHSAFTHDEEARQLLKIFREAQCHFFAHDYGGAGSVRETLMIQAGLPIQRIMNFSYVRATASHMIRYVDAVRGELRGFWSLDKARSLVLQATCLKAGQILLPEYESSMDVTSDLLALMEDKHEMPAGSDIYLIRRQPKMSDDFAHALNYGCLAIWHTEQNWPDLSAIQGIKLSSQQTVFAAPPQAFSEDIS